ncbi:MAG: GHKL domain-containing protein [Candidatus Margulisbacteria bacterium]|nr:GHKL domain-containing protein [Candidatus Margulisiibacteriota bacterium]MBU1022261.1 GHKL domain-containing protein [Candidatus Margulisiibacteriota bacterium]MBU1729300.1 GHKL domain-containing protein [Candidatus Margulisiibacteriota bacterium]MBU1767994.1 GHKL domain-containing protein [Candidatus Omnitrophota bacterium]MBU1955573.1 GHKL domain-containing protein [Candidatus Margulisiibacteriota bacterium]
MAIVSNYSQDEHQLIIQDLKNKFSWALWSRYIIAAFAIVLIYLGLISDAYMQYSLGLVTFLITYNIIAHIISLVKTKYSLWQITTLAIIFQVFDIISITVLIYITGWLDSPFWYLYLVLIVFSGFGMFSYYSFTVFLIAICSAVFYTGLLFSAYIGIFPLYGPSFNLTPNELLISINNKAVFTLASFFIFASTIYYFSKLLAEHRAELSRKNYELLKTMEEMKDIDRMKDEFVSTASHELRTPLSVARENMSLIKDGVIGDVNEQQKKLLSTSLTNVDRLSGILNNLLDLSKIESRSLDLFPQINDLGEMAKKAIELLQEKADHKKIKFELYCPQPVNTLVDPDQILRVFINLIDNAIKYTEKNGKITIGVESTDNKAIAYVSDNGKGIPKKDFSRIFVRFSRLSDFDEPAEKGSGLGLSICRGIVEMHHGKIWVESEFGKGSKFIFTLPKVGEKK